MKTKTVKYSATVAPCSGEASKRIRRPQRRSSRNYHLMGAVHFLLFMHHLDGISSLGLMIVDILSSYSSAFLPVWLFMVCFFEDLLFCLALLPVQPRCISPLNESEIYLCYDVIYHQEHVKRRLIALGFAQNAGVTRVNCLGLVNTLIFTCC